MLTQFRLVLVCTLLVGSAGATSSQAVTKAVDNRIKENKATLRTIALQNTPTGFHTSKTEPMVVDMSEQWSFRFVDHMELKERDREDKEVVGVKRLYVYSIMPAGFELNRQADMHNYPFQRIQKMAFNLEGGSDIPYLSDPKATDKNYWTITKTDAFEEEPGKLPLDVCKVVLEPRSDHAPVRLRREINGVVALPVLRKASEALIPAPHSALNAEQMKSYLASNNLCNWKTPEFQAEISSQGLIRRDGEPPRDFLARVDKWMNANFKYGKQMGESSLAHLKNRQAVCTGTTDVWCAILRANNIPARGVSGMVLKSDQSVGHQQVQYFDEQYGQWAYTTEGLALGAYGNFLVHDIDSHFVLQNAAGGGVGCQNSCGYFKVFGDATLLQSAYGKCVAEEQKLALIHPGDPDYIQPSSGRLTPPEPFSSAIVYQPKQTDRLPSGWTYEAGTWRCVGTGPLWIAVKPSKDFDFTCRISAKNDAILGAYKAEGPMDDVHGYVGLIGGWGNKEGCIRVDTKEGRHTDQAVLQTGTNLVRFCRKQGMLWLFVNGRVANVCKDPTPEIPITRLAVFGGYRGDQRVSQLSAAVSQ